MEIEALNSVLRQIYSKNTVPFNVANIYTLKTKDRNCSQRAFPHISYCYKGVHY